MARPVEAELARGTLADRVDVGVGYLVGGLGVRCGACFRILGRDRQGGCGCVVGTFMLLMVHQPDP